jgi:hypothetical protein
MHHLFHYNKGGNVRTNVTVWVVRVTIIAAKKTVGITYSESMSVGLVIQYAKRMRRIILSSVACLVLPYFSTLSSKRHDLRIKFIGLKVLF